jgi:hypothetical protein
VPLNLAPKSPAATQAQEREARMMVGDLLDLGMQQRRAYQQTRTKPPIAPGNKGTP